MRTPRPLDFGFAGRGPRTWNDFPRGEATKYQAKYQAKNIREDIMRDHIERYRVGNIATTQAALIGVSLIALSASAFAAEYKMTVNKDRLINSANEPQNWLMMNGDYGSTRYSKLAQINRDNVKNLHLVWALALRGMQDVGQNGPENEVNPLGDNGFMYTRAGWGTG